MIYQRIQQLLTEGVGWDSICLLYTSILLNNEEALGLLVRRLAENVKQPISYTRLANLISSIGIKTVSYTHLVVNIGYKSDGIIPLNEFRYNPDLKIDVYFYSITDLQVRKTKKDSWFCLKMCIRDSV